MDEAWWTDGSPLGLVEGNGSPIRERCQNSEVMKLGLAARMEHVFGRTNSKSGGGDRQSSVRSMGKTRAPFGVLARPPGLNTALTRPTDKASLIDGTSMDDGIDGLWVGDSVVRFSAVLELW